MRGAGLILTTLIALAAAGTVVAQQGPVVIVGLDELSGVGATSGTYLDNGVKLAVKETPRPRRRLPRRSRRRPSTRMPMW